MSKQIIYALLLGAIFAVTSCKSEYDGLLRSTDPKLKYDKAYEYYEAEEYIKAQTLFEQIMPYYRNKKEMEDLFYKYSYTHYHLKRYITASHYFKTFTSTFPNSEKSEDASYMVAYSNFKMSPVYRLDQTYTAKAIDGFQLFVNSYPDSEKVSECNRLIDLMRLKLEKKAFEEAQLYFDLQNYQSSTHAFQNLLSDYPDSKNAEKIRFMIVDASYRLAQKSVERKQKERYETTIEHYQEFAERYPTSEYSKSVENIYKSSQQQLKKINQ